MKLIRQLGWFICFGILLAACGQDGAATPTAVPLLASPLPPTDTPTAVSTAEPSPEPSPTHTAVPIPTATAEPSPTPEPTDTAVPTQTEITIAQPAVGSELMVGQEVTINGRAFPVPTEPLRVQITVAGNMDVLNETAVVDAAGNWSVTAVLSPTIVGPANVTAHLPAVENGAAHSVTLVPDNTPGDTSISIVRPAAGDTAVAGYTILFEGRVSHPVDDTVTITVLDDECTATLASQEFTVSGGNWIGYIIIPAEATPGPACAIATTGTSGTADGREARIPITILAPDAEEAFILQLGNSSDIFVKAGENSYLFGLAINAPENAVNIRLESDDPEQPAQLITSATAFADQYGYWGIDLEIPADAQGTAVFYITTGNSNDASYREIRLPVTIQQ